MNDYLKMLLEYKQAESALRKRIAALGAEMKSCPEPSGQESLARRKKLLETELYDLLEVTETLARYAYPEEESQCKGA